MTLTSSTARPRRQTLGALCAAAIVAGGYWLTAPDAMLSIGFDAALAEHARATPSLSAASRSGEREGALLRTTSLDAAMTSGRSFTVGDRISMHGKDGRDTTYVVVDVHDIEPAVARERTLAGPRLLLVTARPSEPQSAMRPLRFVVEADDADTSVPVAGAPRAL